MVKVDSFKQEVFHIEQLTQDEIDIISPRLYENLKNTQREIANFTMNCKDLPKEFNQLASKLESPQTAVISSKTGREGLIHNEHQRKYIQTILKQALKDFEAIKNNIDFMERCLEVAIDGVSEEQRSGPPPK